MLENYAAVVEELIRAKPSAAKGRYLRTITITSTMGPGVKVDPARTRNILEEAAAAELIHSSPPETPGAVKVDAEDRGRWSERKRFTPLSAPSCMRAPSFQESKG